MAKRITGKPVRQINFGSIVDRVEGKERNKRDDIYEFDGGQRVFKDTEQYGGIYSIEGGSERYLGNEVGNMISDESGNLILAIY